MNSTIDAIYQVVEDAIDGGMSVDEFRKHCAQAWDEYLSQKRRLDRSYWEEKK